MLVPAVALLALVVAAAAIADPGDKGKGKKKGGKFTFTVVTTDNGSCGNPWATDTSQRTFMVKRNADGTYTLTRKDKGTFVTLGGVSPGKCDPTGRHGTTVNPGIKGRFAGYLRGTVSGGTFNPNATCTTDCGFTDVFITTFFGSSAKFTCFEGYAGCKFNFNYSSSDKSLKFHHWQDRGTNGTTEEFVGDIANA